MNRAEIGVLEQSDEISLGSLLESGDGAALEPKIRLEILCDLPHQPLERQLPYEKLGALLVLPDLPERDGSRPESVRLLHSSSRRGRLASSLRRQLLPWRLASGGFPCCLLGTSHDWNEDLGRLKTEI
ncbi:hypothetical protein LINGRAHAP2_LOCUS21769 [Linum grandiflorum]